MGVDEDDVELQKSNILLLGPHRLREDLLAQTLARSHVPFAIATRRADRGGYVAQDVENILLKPVGPSRRMFDFC